MSRLTAAQIRTFAVGTVVRCERAAPAKGTWSQYAGRVGKVASVNRIDGEIGVAWDLNHPRPAADSWFLPTELVVHDSAGVPLVLDPGSS